MFVLTPESRLWRLICLLALVPLVISYFWYSASTFPHGGSLMGLIYGAISLVLIAVLLFLGIRKRWYRCTYGRLEAWTQSHVYLGLLVVIVLLFHTGFRFEDKIALAAFVVLLLVVVSGIIGIMLYTVLPMLLTSAENNMSPEEISAQLNQQSKAMARVASGKSPMFQKIHDVFAAEAKPGFLAGWALLFSRKKVSGSSESDARLDELLTEVPPAEGEDLKLLLVMSRQQKELHHSLRLQQRYKNMLAVWLFFHVPLSIVMIVLITAHLVGAIYYSEWMETLMSSR